jgi:endoglucanase
MGEWRTAVENFSVHFRHALSISSLCVATALSTTLALAGEAKAEFSIGRAINIAQWFTWPRYEQPGAGIAWPPYRETPRPPNASELQDLRRAGFDTVRLPVDPAPFMVFTGERREAVYGILWEAVRRIRAADLKVIVDFHPNSRHQVWGQNAIIAGFEAPAFVAFSNATEEMARRLQELRDDGIAFELINEPRLKCKGPEQELWQRMMGHLVARARAGSRDLPLVVTGACISTPEGLTALDPAALGDGNLIFTFHYYEPFTFTHQGAQFIPWPDKYLDEVPWPAGARPISEPLEQLKRGMQTVSGLDDAARYKALTGAQANLQRFYASGAGPALIEKRFAEVRGWADRHRIRPKRIFIGEFGVLRKQGNLPGARCEDRMRWLADTRAAAEKHGFTWAYFNYDGPFGIVSEDDARALDPAVLASLGLRHGGQCTGAEPRR